MISETALKVLVVLPLNILMVVGAVVVLRRCLNSKYWRAPDLDDAPPMALTDQHVAALEVAIRAEGYAIWVNDETGEVRLQRPVK